MALDADPIRTGPERGVLNDLPAYILAGGESRRFGSDKARALLNGTPLIVHAARQLRPAAAITAVARRPGQYADLGVETIADIRPGLGPLGGLEAALEHCGRDSLLLVACDWARPSWMWAEDLAAARGDAAAAAYRSPKGWEPLFAVYHQQIRPAVADSLDRGRLSMQALLDAGEAVAVPLPPDWTPQINTRRDLERAAEA